MVKGTLYIGFEAYEDNGLAERFEPLKVYVDGFVSLGDVNTDNVYVVTVDVAGTVTLPANAESYVENVGTKKDVKLKFYIPKGERGEDGYTPIVGKDFYTDAERAEFAESIVQMFPVDAELSEISENPVQNKVIYNKFNEHELIFNDLISHAEDCITEDLLVVVDGEVAQIKNTPVYNEEDGVYYSVNANFKDTKAREMIGDIETALDSIIAIQNELIGGDAE